MLCVLNWFTVEMLYVVCAWFTVEVLYVVCCVCLIGLLWKIMLYVVCAWFTVEMLYVVCCVCLVYCMWKCCMLYVCSVYCGNVYIYVCIYMDTISFSCTYTLRQLLCEGRYIYISKDENWHKVLLYHHKACNSTAVRIRTLTIEIIHTNSLHKTIMNMNDFAFQVLYNTACMGYNTMQYPPEVNANRLV